MPEGHDKLKRSGCDGSDVQAVQAVQDFCFASQRLKEMPVSKEAKQFRSASKEMKESLIQELESSKRTHVPVQTDDGTVMHVKLGCRRTLPDVSATSLSAIVSKLSRADVEEARRTNPALDLPSLICKAVERVVRASCAEKPTVTVSKAAPRASAACSSASASAASPPSDASGLNATNNGAPVPAQLMEKARRLCEAEARLKRINAERREARKPLEATAKQCEQAVAEHLRRHDPPTCSQRVQLMHAPTGASKSYMLKRSEKVVRRKPTLKSSLPVLRETLAKLCVRLEMKDVSSLAVLQREGVLSQLKAMLEEGMTTPQKAKVSVSMTQTR